MPGIKDFRDKVVVITGAGLQTRVRILSLRIFTRTGSMMLRQRSGKGERG